MDFRLHNNIMIVFVSGSLIRILSLLCSALSVYPTIFMHRLCPSGSQIPVSYTSGKYLKMVVEPQ